ncbi:MAG: hypothetical protein IJY67_02070 [Paludibacteraceae bacterium]|nr:hypothetical protein [Paludibacteraceae bacterium]
MKQKLDTLWFGMLIGLIMPVVMLYLFIQNNTFVGFSLKTILELASTNSMIVKLLCIAVFPDMAIVFLLNTWEMWRACRGVFASLFLFIAISAVFVVINS